MLQKKSLCLRFFSNLFPNSARTSSPLKFYGLETSELQAPVKLRQQAS